MQVRRLPGNPIVRPGMDARMGENVNGPSLIRMPSWVERPLGRYYLYFGHHDGRYIRLAVADDLAGPWRTHEPGVLELAESGFAGHVASPDMHVVPERSEIRMYFHGSDFPSGPGPEMRPGMLPTPLGGRQLGQHTRVAISRDGLTFEVRPELLGSSYFRVFRWDGWWYALVMPGLLMRSRDGLSGFEPGPTLFTPAMRHSALRIVGDRLEVFYSNAGDSPERILRTTIDLRPGWLEWRASEPTEVLAPETDYEGGHLPLAPSKRGLVDGPVRQLRDPATYEEDGRTYLLYSVAGEHGIAIAELIP